MVKNGQISTKLCIFHLATPSSKNPVFKIPMVTPLLKGCKVSRVDSVYSFVEMSSLSARYAPMNRAHIPGFPNRIPNVDWKTYLQKSKE